MTSRHEHSPFGSISEYDPSGHDTLAHDLQHGIEHMVHDLKHHDTHEMLQGITHDIGLAAARFTEANESLDPRGRTLNGRPTETGEPGHLENKYPGHLERRHPAHETTVPETDSVLTGTRARLLEEYDHNRSEQLRKLVEEDVPILGAALESAVYGVTSDAKTLARRKLFTTRIEREVEESVVLHGASFNDEATAIADNSAIDIGDHPEIVDFLQALSVDMRDEMLNGYAGTAGLIERLQTLTTDIGKIQPLGKARRYGPGRQLSRSRHRAASGVLEDLRDIRDYLVAETERVAVERKRMLQEWVDVNLHNLYDEDDLRVQLSTLLDSQMTRLKDWLGDPAQMQSLVDEVTGIVTDKYPHLAP